LAELKTKLQARARLPGPNYIMFNNIYSKQDALRFCGGVVRADDDYAREGS
jgi:hypothetical protein